MTIKGYSSVEDVQGLVGLDFTETQETQVLRLIEAAEAFVDQVTDRDSWGNGSQIVDEYYETSGPRLHLKSAPVLTVDLIKAQWDLQTNPQTLTVVTDYQLVDRKAGLLIVSDTVWSTLLGYDYILVTYTPEAYLPADLRLGVTTLVAHWMATHFDPARLSYSLYTMGDGDLSARPIQGIPKDVTEILDNYRKGKIIFA